MSSPAAARAEARRKAILSRGSDRLNKLATSARGEDAPQFVHDDPPLPSLGDKFLGDSSDMPTLNTTRASLSPSPSPSVRQRSRTPSSFGEPDPSVWSSEQQQQFMQALVGGMGGMNQTPGGGAAQPQIALGNDTAAAAATGGLPSMEENPLAAMMQQFGLPPPGPSAAGKAPADFPGMKPKPPPTRLQKLLPLLHLLGVWCLLAYFVLYVEPDAHRRVAGVDAAEAAESRWDRWADLARRKPTTEADSISGTGWFVQIVPFFWAFTTLQIAVHSARIFSGFDTVEPPTLLALALPSLPPPFPSIIMNGLKYMQMLNLFMDDLAALLFGVGFVVVIANYFTNSPYV